MAYCPECKYEFNDNIKKCPDCETELVDELEENVDKLVMIGDIDSDVLADMVGEALENEGIESVIKSDFFHDAFLTESTSMPGTHSAIFVPESKKEKAEQIIDSIISEK